MLVAIRLWLDSRPSYLPASQPAYQLLRAAVGYVCWARAARLRAPVISKLSVVVILAGWLAADAGGCKQVASRPVSRFDICTGW